MCLRDCESVELARVLARSPFQCYRQDGVAQKKAGAKAPAFS